MTRLNGDGNVILTDDVIVANALRLLKNELVYARLVHRDLEQRFGKVGDTVSIKLPFRTKTASGRTLVKQPMVDRLTTLKIDRQEHFALEFNQIERSLSLQQFSDRYLKSGISQLAHVIDRSIAETAARQFFFSSGTPGTALNTDTFTDVRAYMTMVGVPIDGMVNAVLNPLDGASVQKDVKKFAHQGLVKRAIEASYLGPLSGINAFETAQAPMHTVGNHGGTPLVNGAGQTGLSLVTDGWTNSVTGILNVGDIFTIAGVFEINPRTYETTGRLQRFVVTAQANSGATTGPATISISPPINDGSLTTLDAEGNSVSLAAFQNVTNAPADNAVITVIGTAGTVYRQSVAFHKDAIALAMIDIELPESAVVKKRVRDDESGVSLAMTGAFDINDLSQIYRIDALWGVKAIYPELGHRIYSAAAS